MAFLTQNVLQRQDKATPLAVIVVPQLLQFVLASLHVVLGQTLQTLLLGLHHLADVSWKHMTQRSILYINVTLIKQLAKMFLLLQHGSFSKNALSGLTTHMYGY